MSLFKQKGHYYKPIRVGNFWKNSYIEYKSSCDRSKSEVQNSRVTKSCYETELHKMRSHFELLTRSQKIKSYTPSY